VLWSALWMCSFVRHVISDYNIVVVENTQIVTYLLSQNMLHHQRLTFSICPNFHTRHMVLLLSTFELGLISLSIWFIQKTIEL